MADDADACDLEREAVVNKGVAAILNRPRVHPLCENCRKEPVMIVMGDVFARYCAPCWEDVRPVQSIARSKS